MIYGLSCEFLPFFIFQKIQKKGAHIGYWIWFLFNFVWILLVCIYGAALVFGAPRIRRPSYSMLMVRELPSRMWNVCPRLDLRAFQWTGRRLLPIMKSVQPIIGMLVILLFLMLAFVHAFWALHPHNADEACFTEWATLFKGQFKELRPTLPTDPKQFKI